VGDSASVLVRPTPGDEDPVAVGTCSTYCSTADAFGPGRDWASAGAARTKAAHTTSTMQMASDLQRTRSGREDPTTIDG
jgi:hypothetical protein